MIQAAYTIAKLPEGPLPGNTRTQFADLYSVVGSRRRKRSELAVAIDLSCITLYDVRSAKLITSYNVSPQTTFTCPPCSIRLRKQGLDNPQRFTYCSTNSTSKKPALQLFQQESDKDYDVVSSALQVRQPAKPITHLGTVARTSKAGGATSIELLAVHEDGEVRCYTENLDRELWTANTIPDDQSSGSVRVEYACCITVGEARKALLKGREDIVESLLSSNNTEAERLLLLFAVSGSKKTLMFRLLRLNAGSTNSHKITAGDDPALQAILSFSIPAPTDRSTSSLQTSFHVPSGTLYRNTSSTLTTYDLSGCTPRARHETFLSTGGISSCVRISPSLVSLSVNNTISVHDLRYNTCQGQLTLPKQRKHRPVPTAGTEEKGSGTPLGEFVLLSYNSQLDLVVALKGRELKAFQLSTSVIRIDGSRKRKREGLLIDSIGHGTTARKRRALSPKPTDGSFHRGLSLLSQKGDDQWNEARTALDQCLDKDDMQELGRLLSLDLEPCPQADRTTAPADNTTTALRHPRRFQYVITKFLELDNKVSLATNQVDGTARKLKVAKSVKTIPEWLFSQGRLSDYQVEAAFRHQGLLSSSEKVELGSVIHALAHWDTSFKTLLAYIKCTTSLTAFDTIHGLRYAISSNRRSAPTNGMKLLTNGENAHGGQSQSPTSHGPNAPEDTPSPGMQGPDDTVTQQILKTVVEKLFPCPALEVSNALRTTLSRPEIRFLIDMLRIQLAQNGWLTPYDDREFHTPVQKHSKTSEMSLMAHLLSCAIDSIGTGGWILGGSVVDDLIETAETVAYMKAEISAALEGIEEATYLKGMLGEVLLYGNSYNKKYPNAHKQLQSETANERTQPAIISLGDGEDHTLPLGLKIPQDISRYKVGAGGELIKRSARDIGRLKSRTVPKYSFERIMI